MKIILEHKFLKRAHDINGLLKGVKKISTFCTRLEQQSILWPDRYDPDKYKGDGFELFVEVLIKLNPVNPMIGIYKYAPILENDDTGVDGYGLGGDLQPATVQVKYRHNNIALLKANEDRLTNFTWASVAKYHVDVNSEMNMLIITTAKDLHYFTKNEMLLNKVRCLGYEELRILVDNNMMFWDAFREAIQYNLTK